MQAWLIRLSGAFVVAATGFGGYVFLQGDQGERFAAEAVKLRPALDDLVGQGEHALRTLIETAQAAGDSAVRSASAHESAQLPFVVLEPRDRAAPAGLVPAAVQPAPTSRTPLPEELRLTEVLPDAGPLDLEPVEARLRARMPGQLFRYFDLYLYVSKAVGGKGEWAQQMFVLARQNDDTMKVLHRWPVSTGLEEPLKSPAGRMLGTNTPGGIYKLDRGRFFEDYTSRQWQSPMPYAMFFDWMREGRVSGLAIHGTDDAGVATLGQRASHGCIRLSPANAKTLFELIQGNYRGRVPAFEVNPETGTMSAGGKLKRDEDGKVIMTRGYKVIVFIEDFGGPSQDTVATLY